MYVYTYKHVIVVKQIDNKISFCLTFFFCGNTVFGIHQQFRLRSVDVDEGVGRRVGVATDALLGQLLPRDLAHRVVVELQPDLNDRWSILIYLQL